MKAIDLLREYLDFAKDKDRVPTKWLEGDDLRVYVRITKRYINKKCLKVLDIATVESLNPGNGFFKSFMLETIKISPWSIFLENILTKRLASHVEREYNPKLVSFDGGTSCYLIEK